MIYHTERYLKVRRQIFFIKNSNYRTKPYVVRFFYFMEIIICKKCSSENDYYTQQRGIHTTAFCNKCNSYIKNLPQGKPAQLFFGKYKDRLISDMTNKEEVGYLQWLLKTDVKPNSLKQAITYHLNSL